MPLIIIYIYVRLSKTIMKYFLKQFIRKKIINIKLVNRDVEKIKAIALKDSVIL